jgi:hypothetical protein
MLLASAVSAARPLPRAAGTDLRVLVWNVSRSQFFEHQKGYIKALSAVDADLLILDEMPADRSIDDVRAVLAQIDSRREPDWQIAYGSSGDNQRTVFALRGHVQALPEFAFLPYPESIRKQLTGMFSEGPQRLGMQQKLDGGIASFGVEARIGKHSALLVGVDLTCCGDSDDAWEEQARIVEAKEIRAALDQAWAQRRVDAVIVAGDFNAVRGRKPLLPIQGDSSSGDGYLRVAEAAHANGTELWTWDGRGTPFPSRPLDFILHNDGLQLLHALVFDPETMTRRERKRLGLRRESLTPLSAHRPVIADFAWR